MEAKRDQKVYLALSYYSNNLLQNLLMDACVGKLIVKEMMVAGKQTMQISELVEKVQGLAKILRNEYLLRDKREFSETVVHRCGLF